MARSKSHGRSKSQTRSKSRSRKGNQSKSPGRGKIKTPKSEPNRSQSRGRGRPRKIPLETLAKRSISPHKTPAKPPVTPTTKKTPAKTPAKIPTKTPVKPTTIQRTASRSTSRNRNSTPKTPTVTSAPVSAQRQSRSTVKSVAENPFTLHKLSLARSKSPKKVISLLQKAKNTVYYYGQNAWNGSLFRLRRTVNYIRVNQQDIFWTLVMLAFILLIVYVFCWKGTKLDPYFKYGRDQYHRAAQYISSHYHHLRDQFYKK